MELLIVVGIIALLTAILTPAFQGVRAQAQRATCAANLHNVGLALGTYAMTSRRWLPTRYGGEDPAFDTFRMRTDSGAMVNLGLLVPYISQPETFYCPSQQADRSPGIAFDSPSNQWQYRTGAQVGVVPATAPLLLAPLAGWSGGQSGSDNGNGGTGGSGEDGGTTQPGPGGNGPRAGVNSSFAVRAREADAATAPRWTTLNYGNKVVYSDFIGVDDWPGRGRYRGGLRAPHDGAGCNRLFGEGSVGWAGGEGLNRLRPVTADEPTLAELDEYYRLLDVLP